MSVNTVYANVKPKDTSKETMKDLAMETEEVTYSDINIIKTAKSDQKDSDADEEAVIYAQVKVPQKANDLDPAAPTDPSAPAKPDTADSSLKPYLQKEGHAFKCTEMVLLAVCVLLLVVAVTMGALYIIKEGNYSGVKEDLEILKVKHANVTFGLEANISEITQTLERLQEQYANATMMRVALEANLSEQKERNNNLTEEVTKVKQELQAMRRCAESNKWKYHMGSWYHFSTDFKNWNESKDACVEMGGHLAIIKSQTQTDFLKNTNGDYWIGLSQAQPEGDWYWVDNTELTDPEFWNIRQPDDYRGEDPDNGEDCVNISWGKWNDNTCSKRLKRICESKSCMD